VIPLLDTSKAKAVSAGEVAVGGLTVAHGALHSYREEDEQWSLH
tara:strand:- start:29576 stop:29707 length:132 start_codon:yes stop_codon:yes gene_type:complete